MKELKPIDYKLLFELMKDSHRSDRQIAKALGVSQPTDERLAQERQTNRKSLGSLAAYSNAQESNA